MVKLTRFPLFGEELQAIPVVLVDDDGNYVDASPNQSDATALVAEIAALQTDEANL